MLEGHDGLVCVISSLSYPFSKTFFLLLYCVFFLRESAKLLFENAEDTRAKATRGSMIAESRIIAAGKVIPIPWATIPFFSAEIRVYYLWYLSLFFITFWYEGSGLRGEGRTRTKEPFPSPSCSWSPRWSIWYCNQYHCCVIIIPRLLFCFLNHVIKDINQDISVGDIGLIEVPKEDRQKHGQRNLLVQVLDLAWKKPTCFGTLNWQWTWP